MRHMKELLEGTMQVIILEGECFKLGYGDLHYFKNTNNILRITMSISLLGNYWARMNYHSSLLLC